MQFLKIKDQTEAGEILAGKIGENLKQNKKVLWLLSGGSNIGIAVETLNLLKKYFGESLKDNLAVTLMDERYGQVGHADSNWQQLLLGGFDFTAVKSIPVLQNLEPKETVIKFGKNYRDLTAWADVIIGQFGLGSDGHTAGVLPETIGVTDQGTACFYTRPNLLQGRDIKGYDRITLTLKTIINIDIAHTFAFGESKEEIIKSLQTQDISLEEMPAQILKEILESYLYSDVI
jgi:6-phosphogluconolactonase/glucosamine-6-phosphate isomerase/deaminase